MAEPAAPPWHDAVPAVGRAVLLAAGLAGAGWALKVLPLHDLAGRAAGLGMPRFVLLGAIACAVGVPRQVIAFAAGYAFGAVEGAACALAAQVAGCLADLLWARLVARDWARARLRGKFATRLARLEAFLAAHPFGATLTLRLLPVGNNLALNLLAGSLGVRPAMFLTASAIGYLPQTAVFALLGSGVRIGRGAELAIALLTFVASMLLGLSLLRQQEWGRAPGLPTAAATTPPAAPARHSPPPGSRASPPPPPAPPRAPPSEKRSGVPAAHPPPGRSPPD